VREFKLEPYLRPEARHTFDSLNGILQNDVEHRIDFLSQYPEPDDELTFAWPEEGPDTFIFYDEAWVIVYALRDDASVLEILMIAPAGRR
jgi:hypothetical protein